MGGSSYQQSGGGDGEGKSPPNMKGKAWLEHAETEMNKVSCIIGRQGALVRVILNG